MENEKENEIIKSLLKKEIIENTNSLDEMVVDFINALMNKENSPYYLEAVSNSIKQRVDELLELKKIMDKY